MSDQDPPIDEREEDVEEDVPGALKEALDTLENALKTFSAKKGEEEEDQD